VIGRLFGMGGGRPETGRESLLMGGGAPWMETIKILA
jgi:hypothetical protein